MLLSDHHKQFVHLSLQLTSVLLAVHFFPEIKGRLLVVGLNQQFFNLSLAQA